MLHLGAKNEKQGELIALMQDRFSQGKAVEFTYDAKMPGRQFMLVRIIPEVLFSEVSTGLMIAVVGMSAYSWDGSVALSPFKLISSGVRPMAFALDLAYILNRTLVSLYHRETRYLSSVKPLELTHANHPPCQDPRPTPQRDKRGRFVSRSRHPERV